MDLKIMMEILVKDFFANSDLSSETTELNRDLMYNML